MRIPKFACFSPFLIGVAAFLLPPGVSATSQHWDPSVAKKTALVLRSASRLDAKKDFLTTVALCLNGPRKSFFKGLSEAWKEYKETLELIEEQFNARLEVNKFLGHGPYDPDIDPDDFKANVDNHYFPLKPGRTLIYEKKTKEETERIEVTVLKKTIKIEEVECRVVRDVVIIDGEIEEDTFDWFSQDKKGNVWYFGEIAKNYEDGLLDNLDGSWRTGKDGAKPGILMKAHPKPGDAYRQEYLVNEAEDVALVLAVGETIKVPAGTFKNCLKTLEGSPLEPGVFEWKYYAPGIGMILEVDTETGERTELIKIVDK